MSSYLSWHDGPTGDPHWGSVLLLQNAQGTSTTDAAGLQTLTQNGSVPINSTRTLFGRNTYEVAAAGNWISVANASFFSTPADAQEWTIEGWAYITNIVDATAHLVFNDKLAVRVDGVSCPDINSGSYSAAGGNMAINQWVHWAFVRDNSSGGLGRLRRYLGGVQVASSATFALTDQMGNVAGFNSVMCRNGLYAPIGSFTDFRWTMGVCRYPGGTTFAVPTAAFPTST